MNYTIQNLVLPVDEKHQACRKLFYRGDHGIIDEKKQRLILGFAQHCDFTTYLNACSWQKWQKYTHAENITLHLYIRGDAKINLVGYHKEAFSINRHNFYTKEVHHDTCKEVILPFPDNHEQMIGFEIVALSKQTTIYKGFYTTKVETESLNPISLHIATTTCKKEAYIKKNLRSLQQEIFSKKNELSKNLHVHVVDNGQTLQPADMPSVSFTLHPNLNTGGSGGFARGMIEALDREATHVLLMDDDVLILPESIRRTFNLLKLLRPEYRDHFINGAMLYYENPECQHEDVGILQRNGVCNPLKGEFNHAFLRDNLQNEQEYPTQNGVYGAWWYCCIPRRIIARHGLPLPMFIRGDDVEYSVRCQAKFITMNGICIWHLGFASKHSNMLKYQSQRNHMITQVLDQAIDEQSILNTIYNAYRQEMLRFNYDGAYASIRVIEDFCKGPNYLKNIIGPEIIAEFTPHEQKLIPLSEIEGGNSFRVEDVWHGTPMSLKTRFYLKLTWNGQRFCRQNANKRGTNQIIFDGDFLPERVVKFSRLLAVEPFYMMGTFQELNRTKFKELHRRYRQAMKYYHQHHSQIVQNWQDARAELTSFEYWRDHLQLK